MIGGLGLFVSELTENVSVMAGDDKCRERTFPLPENNRFVKNC
jgi:hypothetical protein